MRSRCRVVSLKTSCLLILAGCSAVTGAADQAETDDDVEEVDDGLQSEVNQRLTDLGFQLEEGDFDGNVIRFGDAVLFRDKLLNGEYDWSLPPYSGVQKAHYVGGGMPVDALKAWDIKLAWSTNVADAPTTTIKNAFIDAAGDFNSTCNAAAPNDCWVNISQNNTGPWIVVHEVASGSWPPFSCTASQVACALYPSGGNPGGHIYVKKSALTPSCSSWTVNALKHMTRHELSHTLGIMHPGQGTLITGTASQVSTPSQTVMNELGFDGSCNFSPIILQSDDKLGLRKLYDVP